MCEKKNVYMYFWVILQQLKRKTKKKYAQKVQQKQIWATAQLYCEKKKFVLQPWECSWLGFVLQEKACKVRIVLQ